MRWPPDERGTRRSALEAIQLFRAGQIDEAEDLNPMAIDMYRAFYEHAPYLGEEHAETETILEMFPPPHIPGLDDDD